VKAASRESSVLTPPLPTALERARELVASVAEERRLLARHPLYAALDQPARLRHFAEHHVFAVWDFMSLLKGLQRRLTCVRAPWVPEGPPHARRLINELVLGEESDEDPRGGYISHFEWYLEAMGEIGARVDCIEGFLSLLSVGRSARVALRECGAPDPAARFTASTLAIVESGSLPALAGAFCLGREQVVPEMFRPLLEGTVRLEAPLLRAYLQRHVEVDGGHHGPLALQLLAEVCGASAAAWTEAEDAARLSLAARQRLWDGVLASLPRA
jgi:hypothetical protein